ncbi:MAG: outer membrane beta-barrel family protein [Leeuwenhoekiella sp.]
MRIIFLGLLLLPIFSVVAQGNAVTGTVTDQAQTPVSYANVVIRTLSDSTIVSGAMTGDSGQFLFEGVSQGEYWINISFVGYSEVQTTAFQVKADVDLGSIMMTENPESLDAVNIRYKKPQITRQIDRVVFDVENTALTTGTSFDIIRQTPGVLVINGAISVKNSPATVYLNDKRIYLSAQELQQLLEGLTGEVVQSVEVITNPPAKYDADGGAILNIVTSRNVSVGYKGDVSASNTVAILPKYNFGTSHFYKTKGVDLFLNYNLETASYFKTDESYINYFDSARNPSDRWESDFDKTTDRLKHNFFGLVDFALSEKSTLSFSSVANLMPTNASQIDVLTEIFDRQGSLDSTFTTDSQLDNDRLNLLFNGTFSTALNENGGTLDLQANYLYYDDAQDQVLQTTYFNPSGNVINTNAFNTEASQLSNILTGQLDIITPFGKSNFETGLKYTRSASESKLDFFDENSGNPVDALSDNFEYLEQIFAAYAGLEQQWEQWAMKLGLRAEYTDINGDSRSLGVVNTQEYLEFFPTVNLQFTPNDNNDFYLQYRRRITRPDFSSLNPYRYFLNENNFISGNPDLRPGFVNHINLDYLLNGGKYTFSVYYKHTDNAPQPVAFQNNPGRFIRSLNINMDYEEEYGFDFIYSAAPTQWWYTQFITSFFYMKNVFPAIENGGQPFGIDTYANYSTLDNFFNLSSDGTFSGTLTGAYISNILLGSYSWDRPQIQLSIGLRKTFFDQRLQLSVNVEDILKRTNIPVSSDYLTQDNGFFARPETQFVRFGLKYNFGNFKLSDNERDVEAAEQERLKKQEF